MALITKPDFTYVWASGGAIVAPNDTKKQLGWVAEAPPFQYDNWLQNRQDQMLAHINQRGIPAWDGLTNYEAGGLSYVQGSDGKVYKSVAASGPTTVTQDPATDATNTYWRVSFSSNSINSPRVDVASAANINLLTSAPDTAHINITGTTTISGFTVSSGQLYFVRFAGNLTLTNNASIVTNRSTNISTAVGDSCIIRALNTNVVEILCGDFLSDKGLGYQQTWQDVAASRAAGPVYTNTTGKPIIVSLVLNPTVAGSRATLRQNGVPFDVRNQTSTADLLTLNAVVAPGSTYSLTDNLNVAIQAWSEYR